MHTIANGTRLWFNVDGFGLVADSPIEHERLGLVVLHAGRRVVGEAVGDEALGAGVFEGRATNCFPDPCLARTLTGGASRNLLLQAIRR